MLREHGEISKGIADNILLNVEVRGEGAKNRSDLSGDWFVLLLCCKGHEQLICAKYHTSRPQQSLIAMAIDKRRHSGIYIEIKNGYIGLRMQG